LSLAKVPVRGEPSKTPTSAMTGFWNYKCDIARAKTVQRQLDLLKSPFLEPSDVWFKSKIRCVQATRAIS
jgi:hypothetical protein